MKENEEANVSFWEHLDILRVILFKIVGIVFFFAIVAFLLKNQMFKIVLAPQSDSFLTYSFLRAFVDIPPLEVNLINTELAQQFLIHMKVAVAFGFLAASPYIVYLIYSYISPALYTNEKHYSLIVVVGGYVMFFIGVLLNYFLIFPLTFRFLGTYQVSDTVENLISLESYVSMFITLSMMIGVVFELPIVSLILAKLGILSSAFMKTYRRHAVVVVLIIAAIITPTSDVFTLFVVSIPIYILYELSIFIVSHTDGTIF